MKTYFVFLLLLIFLTAGTGCRNKGSVKTKDLVQKDTSSVADTGFTGIKKYYSDKFLVKEVTFKNGIRQGLMKTFYKSGKLYQTFWYRDGLREDTAIWFFEDGKVYRASPFKNDTMDGTQIQYYRSGKVRAKMNFVKGIRTPLLEEFTQDGKLISEYPELIVKTIDDYNQSGTYKIYLELSKKDVKVTYYRGEYINGLFMPRKYIKLNINAYMGYLELKKTGTPGKNYVGIIAETSTGLGNKHLTYKKIDLPYNDLK
jgi:antitoxin component YwqK of YwqJK toxin-antitoxin module